MIERLVFAFSYALRNMVRDRRRAIFTLLSVAAGVATVVALRTLGLMVTDALTANVQAYLRGDVRIASAGSSVSIFNEAESSHPFTLAYIDRLDAWAADNDAEVTYSHNSELMQVAVVSDDLAGAPALALANFIDPQVYPFYDIIKAEAPAGALLGDLFSAPNSVVLARRAADQIEAAIGDQVRVGQSETLYTVTGIVPDAAESSFDSPMGILFSFVYLDRAEMGQFDMEPVADRAYVKLPPNVDPNEAAVSIRNTLGNNPRGGGMRISTTPDVLDQNQQIADLIARFVLVLSLVGLVIGGVGIINTMVVAVNRRSKEIAVLKTLGLQGEDVSLVFMAEALMSGIAGSFLGVLLGIVLSYFARDLGQQAFAVPLPWRVYLDPAVLGVVLGVIVTVFFSLLPTVMATRIRPSIVLREDQIPMAGAGCLWTILSFVLLIVGFGLLVDVILGTNRLADLAGQRMPSRMANTFESLFNLPPPLTPGILGTLIVFILLGVVLALMWVLVWLLGKLPTFRNANLQIAIRGLSLHRLRTALSLLALIIGMTSLSGTLIMARSINMLLYTTISDPIGGNVIIISLPLVQGLIQSRLDGSEAVTGYREIRFPSDVQVLAIDGARDFQTWFNPEDAQADLRRARLEMTLGVNVYGDPPRGDLVAGRLLGPEDLGQTHIMIPQIDELEAHGVGVGSTFRLDIDGRTRDFEVVGVVAPDSSNSLIPFSLGDFALQIPLDQMPRGSMPFDLTIVDADKARVREVLAQVGSVPGVFVFDVGIFDSIIGRLLSQMSALPLLVAGLALFAASALIATTVALATMERRRQIAILRAVGVSRWQALIQLLLENGIVGLAGGLISILPTLLILELVPALSEGLVRLPVPTDLVILMLVTAVGVTVAATLVTAWGASGERPLNALRYE